MAQLIPRPCSFFFWSVSVEINPYAAAADEEGGGDASEPLFAPPVPSHLQLDAPPFEEQLIQGTLWAELEKLYGRQSSARRSCWPRLTV